MKKQSRKQIPVRCPSTLLFLEERLIADIGLRRRLWRKPHDYIDAYEFVRGLVIAIPRFQIHNLTMVRLRMC